MTTLSQGWTPTTPKHEQIANAIAACKAFLERDPDNVYWQNRLEAYEQQRILDNLTPEAQAEKFGWYDVPEIKDGVSSPAWFEAQPEVEF